MSENEDKTGPELRFSIGLPRDLAEWLEAETARTGVSRRQVVKLALQAYRSGPASPAAKKPKKGRNARQETFLQEVRNHFGASLAMAHAGVEYETVAGWMKDEAFAERFETAQETFLERVEADLVAVGRGAQKGVTAALSAFLEAHHPSYGRLRVEQMTRHVGALIDSFYQIIVLHVGEKLGDTIVKAIREDAQRYLERFSD